MPVHLEQVQHRTTNEPRSLDARTRFAGVSDESLAGRAAERMMPRLALEVPAGGGLLSLSADRFRFFCGVDDMVVAVKSKSRLRTGWERLLAHPVEIEIHFRSSRRGRRSC